MNHFSQKCICVMMQERRRRKFHAFNKKFFQSFKVCTFSSSLYSTFLLHLLCYMLFIIIIFCLSFFPKCNFILNDSLLNALLFYLNFILVIIFYFLILAFREGDIRYFVTSLFLKTKFWVLKFEFYILNFKLLNL